MNTDLYSLQPPTDNTQPTDRPHAHTHASMHARRHAINLIYEYCCRFGKPLYDELSIMAPIYQCCLIRYSTLRRLLAIQQSQTPLSERMRQALARDKLAPILTDGHLAALDRRLNIVLQTLYNCILQHKAGDVIVDDGF